MASLIPQNIYEVPAIARSATTLLTHLWDDGDAGPEVVQTQIAHIHIINHNLPASWLHNAEESKCEGRLPSTSATHDANLYSIENKDWISSVFNDCTCACVCAYKHVCPCIITCKCKQRYVNMAPALKH